MSPLVRLSVAAAEIAAACSVKRTGASLAASPHASGTTDGPPASTCFSGPNEMFVPGLIAGSVGLGGLCAARSQHAELGGGGHGRGADKVANVAAGGDRSRHAAPAARAVNTAAPCAVAALWPLPPATWIVGGSPRSRRTLRWLWSRGRSGTGWCWPSGWWRPVLLIVEAQQLADNEFARARRVRNGLMIALLAVCPSRLKNYSTLEIGYTFKHVHGELVDRRAGCAVVQTSVASRNG